MLKAVLSQGEIQPLEPLPVDWQEGQRLSVEKADDDQRTLEEIDRDFAALTTLCETSEPAEEEQLERALQEARHLAKEQARRSEPATINVPAKRQTAARVSGNDRR